MNPEKKISAGNVSATIWVNEREMNGSTVSVRSISIQKSYKDKEGRWHNSTSFGVQDLPKATLVLRKAYEYLIINEASA